MLLGTYCLACGSPLDDKNYADCGVGGAKPDLSTVESKEDLEAIEGENPKTTCERLSYEDDASVLLDQAAATSAADVAREKYQSAADILAKLVKFYPDEYPRYGRLAAAYAGAAGVELASFLKQMAASSGGVFEMGKDSLTSPEDATYEADKDYLKSAVTWIDAKIAAEGLDPVPTGDNLQSAVYRMADTLLIANGFLVKSEDGTWDQSALENLTPDDVDEIVNNLASISEQIPDPAARAQLEAFQNSSDLSDDEKKELIRQALAQGDGSQ
jgi:hypothetical protein